jgi:diacylglycerol O-acyltransferase
MERMSVLDAGFLYIENDDTPMHIGGAAIFEGPPPTHDELVARIEGKLALVPRYRQKVRFLPLNLGLPGWIDDPHFNIDYHVRRSALPAPGGREELQNLVSRVISQHLDRARPLWEFWVVEGLEQDRWALVSKVHHCMVDGVSSIDLMTVLFDADAQAPPVSITAWRARPEPTAAEVVVQSLVGALIPVGRVAGLVGALRTPRETLERGLTTLRAFANLAGKLLPRRETSLNGAIGPHRRWRSAHGTLDDVKVIRRALGGTVNDVVLAAITKGFRELLVSRGELGDGRPVRTLVPVSVRAESERGTYNNRVSGVFVDLPVGLEDPVARLADIRAQMDGIKESAGALAGERLVELSGFSPPMLLAVAQRLAASIPQMSINTATTNVPGPQHPVYFAGRRLLESAPIVPIFASVRVAVAIFSYDGHLYFGITGDYDSAPDIDVLRRGIETGMDELLAAARAATARATAAQKGDGATTPTTKRKASGRTPAARMNGWTGG